MIARRRVPRHSVGTAKRPVSTVGRLFAIVISETVTSFIKERHDEKTY